MDKFPEAIKNPRIQYTKLFIANEWRESKSGSTFPTVNPSTAEKIADIAEAREEDINDAVAAAKKAFSRNSEWRQMEPSKRCKLMGKLADLIERDAQYLASLETMDNGRPYSTTYNDALKVAKNFRYYAGWTDKNHGKTIPFDGEYFCYTVHKAIGVCGAIIPWNVPMVMFSWKVAPCLAMGNVMVLKPAEQTPLSALYLASLFKEVGFPAGVLNVVPGYGSIAGRSLSHHMDVDKIAFTGSNAVGRLIMEASAASNCKKVTLELGGKNPNIVFPDFDIDTAVKISQTATFANSGQICCSGSRNFVHEDVYDEFVTKCIEEAKNRTVGDPCCLKTAQGPLVSKEQFERVLGFLERASKEGAKVVYGGKGLTGKNGFFLEPTIVTGLTDEMEISKEEVFGPVQQIYKFKSIDEVIDRANNTRFGLAAGVLSNDFNTVMTVANEVNAGVVWVNCYYPMSPGMAFGGVKESGFGRDLGEYAVQHYSDVKTVIMKVPSQFNS